MTTSMKTLLLTLVFSTLGVIATSAIAVVPSTVTSIGGNTYAYFNGTTTTNYDLSTVVYDGTNYSQIATRTPWWSGGMDGGNLTVATLFATAAGDSLSSGGIAPRFQYNDVAYYVQFNGSSAQSIYGDPVLTKTYAVATVHSGGAPEIDGSLAPKVGFLLGCLFLMFGRKKQNTESMMTA